MKATKISQASLCALIALVANACATPVLTADGEVEETATAVQPAGGISGTLMHAIDLGDAHAIEFYDFGDQVYGVRETTDADSMDPLVLKDVGDELTLVDLYRLAVPDAASSDIPNALILADRRMEETRIEESARPVPTIAAEPEVGVISKALVTPPPPTKPCTADSDWGAQWFMDNYCTEGNFRWCKTNLGSADSGRVKTKWFKNHQMEGDFANIGHTAGSHSWVPTDCWPFTCLAKIKKLWEYDVQPRRIESWLVTSSYSSHEVTTWGWSSCGHLQIAMLWK